MYRKIGSIAALSGAPLSAWTALRARLLRLAVWTAIGACASALGSAPAGASEPGAEAQFMRVLERIAEGRFESALGDVEQLVRTYPNFRLAYLVRGDLLLARFRPIGGFGNTGHAARERLEELRAEALARLRASKDPPPRGLVPRHLLVLARAQRHAIVIDASRARAYVYENAREGPRLVADYYATLGKRGVDKQREGDQKTPLGVYHVTSSIPGSRLPELYGWGAFPINYPNEWDRREGRTGHGIWLHGVPFETYARAPWASDGCVALANPEIADLARRVEIGATPVIIAERAEWVTADAWRAEREAFLRRLETWRADWESRDVERYLKHYAAEFGADGRDLDAWSAHKRRVAAAKTWIEVSLANVSVFRSPGARGVLEVNFDQDYRSNNLSQRTRKRQYWIEDGGGWKIAYEAPVREAALRMPESFSKRLTAGASGGRARVQRQRSL